MKFSEFVYKRTDVDEVRNRIREITEELKHASSLEEQIQAVYKMNEVEKEISTADSLVYIRYTVNTKDEFYAKEREYNDRISPILEEEMQKYKEALLHSPFRKELEEKRKRLMEFIQLVSGIFLAVTILCRIQLEIRVPGWVIILALCAEVVAFVARYRISRQLDRLY